MDGNPLVWGSSIPKRLVSWLTNSRKACEGLIQLMIIGRKGRRKEKLDAVRVFSGIKPDS